MARLKVGIIGGGWIARRHVPALDAAHDVRLVAACDAEEARAVAIAEPRGGRAYREWEQMIDREALDALWVCTPPLAHRGPVVAALERGIHVYLEKPVARTMDDAEAIVAAAGRSEAICAVGYQWHATELLDEVRVAAAGQQIAMLVGRNYGPTAARPWFMRASEGGGQILERGSHHIDLQRAIAGEIESVQAVAGSVALAQAGGDIDDVGVLILQFRDGAVGVVNLAWARDGQPGVFAVDVLASAASMWLELGPENYRLTGASGGRRLDARYGDPFERSISRFLEVVRSGEKSRIFCAPDDAARTLAVALACERSLAEGRAVEVSL